MNSHSPENSEKRDFAPFAAVYEHPLQNTSSPQNPSSSEQSSPDFASLKASSIEELYSDDSGIMSLLILGQPRDGKSYTARYVVEALHRRNQYKHLVLVTKSTSYMNKENIISGVSRFNQVVWWDKLSKDEKKDAVQRLEKRCEVWGNPSLYTSQQTLIILDDMSDALRDNEFSLQRLLTEGSHMRTDLIVIYHGFPPALPTLRSLRDNIKNILLTRQDYVRKIADPKVTTWCDARHSAEDILRHTSFISMKHRIQGLIKRSLADEGRPLDEYFVPFKAALKSPVNDLFTGIIGEDNDTKEIISGTGNFSAIGSFIKDIKAEQEQKINKISEDFHTPPNSPKLGESRRKLEEVIDDGEDCREYECRRV